MAFSDEGLEPAVLNNEDEPALILRDHRDRGLQRYWIGGSTDTAAGRTIQYPTGYNSSGSGNHIAPKDPK